MLIANIATIKEKYIFIQRLMLWLTSCIFVGVEVQAQSKALLFNRGGSSMMHGRHLCNWVIDYMMRLRVKNMPK